MNTTNPTDIEVIRSHVVAGGTVKSLNRILGKGRGLEYAISVLAEVERTIGSKNDLSKCTHKSIIVAMRNAAALRLAIDARQHIHLIARYNHDMKETQACMQIGYRGYLARLQEALPGFAAQVECVYKGEKVSVRRDGFLELVQHERLDCFGTRNDADIVGVYAQISYDAGTERVSHVVTMNKAEIDKIKALAPSTKFWGPWYTEKAKVACIRRACKMHFASVTHDLDAADNDNYDGSAAREEATGKAESINARLSGNMKVVSNEAA